MTNGTILSAAMSRRRAVQAALHSALALPLMTAQAAPVGDAAGNQQTRSRLLVAFLSRTGNTRLIARQISRALGAELFEIETAQPYPEDYAAMVAQAQREKEAGFKPPLRGAPPDTARFATVYLGFPIWGMTAPAPIRSFLAARAMSGKRIVPFITHGGYGIGDSLSVIRASAPGAAMARPLVMERPQERQTLATVTQWLASP